MSLQGQSIATSNSGPRIEILPKIHDEGLDGRAIRMYSSDSDYGTVRQLDYNVASIGDVSSVAVESEPDNAGYQSVFRSAPNEATMALLFPGDSAEEGDANWSGPFVRVGTIGNLKDTVLLKAANVAVDGPLSLNNHDIANVREIKSHSNRADEMYGLGQGLNFPYGFYVGNGRRLHTMDFGHKQYTTDANSHIFIPHLLGVTPQWAIAIPDESSSQQYCRFTPGKSDATWLVFTVHKISDGALSPGNDVRVSWEART